MALVAMAYGITNIEIMIIQWKLMQKLIICIGFSPKGLYIKKNFTLQNYSYLNFFGQIYIVKIVVFQQIYHQKDWG